MVLHGFPRFSTGFHPWRATSSVAVRDGSPRPGDAEVDALSFSEGGDKLALGGQDSSGFEWQIKIASGNRKTMGKPLEHHR